MLARWGIPADAELARAERGCNNRTYAVAHRGRRWVLRISQNLSAARARAEHRLLGQVALSDVADRVAVLEAVEAWLAAHRGRLLTMLAAASG